MRGVWEQDIPLEDLRNNVRIMCHQEQCSACEEIRLNITNYVMVSHFLRNLFYKELKYSFIS